MGAPRPPHPVRVRLLQRGPLRPSDLHRRRGKRRRAGPAQKPRLPARPLRSARQTRLPARPLPSARRIQPRARPRRSARRTQPRVRRQRLPPRRPRARLGPARVVRGHPSRRRSHPPRLGRTLPVLPRYRRVPVPRGPRRPRMPRERGLPGRILKARPLKARPAPPARLPRRPLALPLGLRVRPPLLNREAVLVRAQRHPAAKAMPPGAPGQIADEPRLLVLLLR